LGAGRPLFLDVLKLRDLIDELRDLLASQWCIGRSVLEHDGTSVHVGQAAKHVHRHGGV
jgi:hypothetical protein